MLVVVARPNRSIPVDPWRVPFNGLLEFVRGRDRLGGRMKAVIVQGFGGADRLTMSEGPDLVPGKRQVLIRVEVIGVGLVDVLKRRGRLGGVGLTRFGGRFSYAAFFTECRSSNSIGLL